MIEISRETTREDPRATLDHVRSLRFFEGEETHFWRQLLSDIAVLCKSPVLLFITAQDGQWRVNQEFFDDETLIPEKEYLLAASIHLMERVDQNGFAYERLNRAMLHLTIPTILAVKTEAAGVYSRAVLLLVTDRADTRQFNDIVVRTQLVSDIPTGYYIRRQLVHSGKPDGSNQRLLDVLEVTHRVMDKNRFLLSCMTLVNEISARLNCSQVSIGWRKGDYFRTAAISNLENFKRQTDAVGALEEVFEEAFEQKDIVACPNMGDGGFKVDRAHRNYMKRLGLRQVVSIPLSLEDDIVGVLTCEKEDVDLSADEIDAIRLMLNQCVPWLNALHENDRWVGGRILLRSRKMLDALLGFEHSAAKAVALVLSAALLYSIVGAREYKVEGNAMIKTDSVSYISAPYDGLVSEVLVREGDEVDRGDMLLRLDTKELLLKESQETARKISFAHEVEKNRAKEAFADMQIAQSRFKETQTELDRIRYYLDQADLRAQFDGIVVEGDKRELIGAPVSQGDVLLKIARIDAMYAIIKISEKDIDQIVQGAKGRLMLLSRPNDVFDITIDKLVPMAEVDQREGNVFVIRVAIDGEPRSWWRPGMSGVAKINAGERKIIWILTHRLTEFLRMYFWW